MLVIFLGITKKRQDEPDCIFEMDRPEPVPLMEYTKGRALLLKLYANSSLGDEFIGARKMGQVRSAAIRLSAARASR
ncbi:MAG: hypothetical protein EBT07_18415, partial [Actinobacteria bacterium]|nr:hypothetical protein [Actinomycetota bacterium]